MNREGIAWCFGDAIGVDAISPLRFMLDPRGRGERCLEMVDPTFAAASKEGDLLVAGEMFGHGPGHDHSVLALREAGIAGVIARGFAPQFFRHAVGHGLLVAESPRILDEVQPGDRLRFDFAIGEGTNLRSGARIVARVPTGPAHAILAAGGLVPYLRARLEGAAA